MIEEPTPRLILSPAEKAILRTLLDWNHGRFVDDSGFSAARAHVPSFMIDAMLSRISSHDLVALSTASESLRAAGLIGFEVVSPGDLKPEAWSLPNGQRLEIDWVETGYAPGARQIEVRIDGQAITWLPDDCTICPNCCAPTTESGLPWSSQAGPIWKCPICNDWKNEPTYGYPRPVLTPAGEAVARRLAYGCPEEQFDVFQGAPPSRSTPAPTYQAPSDTPKQRAIAARRQRVAELKERMTQQEIAHELDVAPSTVHADLQYLNQHA